MAKNIFVVAEQRNGAFRKISYEAVSEARRLADRMDGQVIATVLGNDVGGSAGQLCSYGADRIIVADDPLLENYTVDAYTYVLAQILAECSPELIIIGATPQGKDLSARLSARLEAGLAMDCVGVNYENGSLSFVRPMFGGKVVAEVEIAGLPKMAAIRPNVMEIVESAREVKIEKATITFGKVASKVVDQQLVSGDKIELTEADIIVSGGRGTDGNYASIEELSELLGAGVGASRSAVDKGWRPTSDQVGQTGKTVSPNLYIACGISGAIQHFAGMSSSKYIVAINKDPDALIFSKADLGVVGDLHDVVPAMIEALKNRL